MEMPEWTSTESMWQLQDDNKANRKRRRTAVTSTKRRKNMIKASRAR